jgi:uncharacterized protein
MESVEFAADRLSLAGDLRIPPGRPAPGLVFTGPFMCVRDQLTGLCAERLAAEGYVTLACDHRGFGQSQGQPHRHEGSAGQACRPARRGVCPARAS